MSKRPPNLPGQPESPDELKGGLRGPVRGVSRIGRRAFGLAFLVICGLMVAILIGLNRGSAFSKGAQIDAFNTPPPTPAAGQQRFGASEPLIVPSAPATAPPPLVLASTSAPNLENSDQHRSALQPGPAQAQPERVATTDAAAQARAAAAEARAQAERKRRELYEAALRSGILTGGNGDASASGAAGSTGSAMFAGSSGAAAGPGVNYANAGAGQAGNLAARQTADQPAQPANPAPPSFLAGPTGQYAVPAANVNLPEGGNPRDFLQAQRFAPVSPYEVVASSVIPAAMITAIDSELPGLISAQIRENVYDSKSGRYLLIPKGSRLIGLYKNEIAYGQSRVLVAWSRLIFPDTTSIDLQNMSGADIEGGAGVAGTVDNHYGKILGAAILTSVLAAGAQLAQPQNTSILAAPSSGQVVGQAVGQQIASVGTQILQKNLNIPPTLHIPKGYPFIVVVDRDIVFPGPYVSGR
jgi:type IV secretion system protein VirB10